MAKIVTVIVGDGLHRNKDRSWSCSFDNRQEFQVLSAKVGRILGKKLMGKGKTVIVRNVFNEYSRKRGKFFREWRSINGKPFKEVVWKIPG